MTILLVDRDRTPSVVVTCAGCGADQTVAADQYWYTCMVCHDSFVLRTCPACKSVVHLPPAKRRPACPACGRVAPHRRWDRNGVTAADAERIGDRTDAVLDPYHRIVAGTVVASAGIRDLHPRDRAELEFAGDGVSIWAFNDGREAEVEVGYDDIEFLRITGRGEVTTTTDAGLVVGGLGSGSSLEGMAVAGVINALTRRTKRTVETFVHCKAGHVEVLVLEDSVPPEVMAVRLGSVLSRVEEARRARAAPAHPAAAADLADQLARLAELHRAGELTDEEFGAAKRRLLGG